MQRLPTASALAAGLLVLGLLSHAPAVRADLIDDIVAANHSPFYSGNVTVLVILTAFSDTDVSERYRVPFATSVSPNFYPDELNSPTALGPALPDFRYDPIFEVSNFYRALSYGNLVYTSVYCNHVTTMQEDDYGSGDNLLQLIAADVLTNARTKGGKSYADYDLTMIVIPYAQRASSTKVTAWGNRVALLNGYDNFRISDDPDEAPGLVNAFAQLLAFPPSDFSSGIDDEDPDQSYGDDTDLMGENGENSFAFTNPINMIRAGWIDANHVKAVERSGFYRLWPLRRENWNKDWDFDLYNILDDNPDFSDTYTDEFSPRVLKLNGYTDTDDVFYAWTRTEVTYITQEAGESEYLRFKQDYSQSILVHKVEDDKTIWVHANDPGNFVINDELKAGSGIDFGESFLTINSSSSRNAACQITYNCRDYTTDPPSILVEASCIETSDRAITNFQLSDFSRWGYTLIGDNGVYIVELAVPLLEVNPSDSSHYGYIGFAETGTNCNGASKTKYMMKQGVNGFFLNSELSLAQVVISNSYYATLLNNTKRDTPLSICYAGAATGGTADYFFREQIYAPNHFLAPYRPYSSLCGSACTGTSCFNCAGFEVCTPDSCTCVTAYDASQADYQLADTACCYGLGTAIWGSTGGAVCSCQSGWSGVNCQVPDSTAVIYEIDVSPDVIYEQGELYLRVSLKVPPILGTTKSNVTCTGVLANGTSVGTVFFGEYFGTAQTSAQQSAYKTYGTGTATLFLYETNDFSSMRIPEGWAPYLNLTCTFSKGTNVNNYAGTYPYSFQIPIESVLALEAPPSFRITNYFPNGSVSVAWRDVVQIEFMPSIYYQVWYAVGRKPFTESYDLSDYFVLNVTSGATSYTFNSFLVGEWYTVRVAARSPEGGIGVTLPVYVKPSNLTAVCSSQQTYTCDSTTCPSDRGTCLNGRCQCKGYYHGDNCELSGCKKSSDAEVCSGHGTCTGTDEFAYCVCYDEWYKFFCDSLDWFDYSIPFEYPGNNNYFLSGISRTVQWRNPDDSESDSVDLYYRYVDNVDTEDIDDKEWIFSRTFVYENNVSSTEITTTQLPEGQYGKYQVLVKDRYYSGLVGLLTINYYTPIPPTAAPTLIVVTTAAPSTPNSDNGEDDGKSIGERLFTDFKAYSIGGIIALIALTIGAVIFVRAKMARRQAGMLRLGKNEIEAAKSPQPASPQDDSQGINRSREVSGADAAAQL